MVKLKVLFCDTEGTYSYKIIGDAIKKYLPRVPDVEYKLANHKKTEYRHLEGFIPEWCLTATPLNNHSYVLNTHRGWFSVGWDLEGMYEWKRLREVDSRYFDVIATVDPVAQEELTKLGKKSIYLPLGFDPEVYRPMEVDEDYKCDVILAGVMYDSRARILKALEPIANQIKIRTINCKHWEAKIIGCKKFITYYHNELVPVDELVKYYCGAKIIIVGNRDYDPNNDMRKTLHSKAIGRIFQETATGRMVLSDDTRENLYTHFDYGKEVVIFHSEEDLREKVMYYLSHDDEREQIAKAGYLRTMSEHTFSHRLQFLCNEIEKIKGC